ncbi:MAG: capsid cement protein [Planctomycetota bacterium]
MADVMRWRYGDTNPVMHRVDSAQVIEIGDPVWQNTDDARPASQISADSLINMQEAFVDNFIGVAMQRSASGDTNPIRVATTGTFEFACAAATFTEGDKVGMAGTTGVALTDQTVVAVATTYATIGKVKKAYTSNTTSVLVQINSTIFTGGFADATASS